MRDPELNNIILAIDEFDDLDETQANSSIEKALLTHFSKIQAGRYVHKGYCSPSNVSDDESDIILNVEQANRKEMKTKCYVYYRILKGTTKYVQCIGHIIIDVKPIISNWIKYDIEKAFYKGNKTKKEEQLINIWIVTGHISLFL